MSKLEITLSFSDAYEGGSTLVDLCQSFGITVKPFGQGQFATAKVTSEEREKLAQELAGICDINRPMRNKAGGGYEVLPTRTPSSL